jgi:hypothetical protein
MISRSEIYINHIPCYLATRLALFLTYNYVCMR